jgi:hypothetical protein
VKVRGLIRELEPLHHPPRTSFLLSVAIWIALAAGIAYHHRVLTSPAARRRARIRERVPVPVPGLYGPYVHARRIG